jgi:hypothetical protein
MKLLTLSCLAVLAASCGHSPSSPSVSQPQNQSSAATSGGTSSPALNPGVTGPASVSPGCLDAAALPAVLEWRIPDVPVDAKIDRAYAHDDTAICEPTGQELRTQNDHLRFERDPAEPGTLIVRFDLNTYDCGHAQVNIDINGVTLLGEVVNYGRDCRAPNNVCVPETSLDSYGFSRTGDFVTAVFSARDEAVGHQFYLTSYGVPTDGGPHQKVGEASDSASLGSNTLTIRIAPPSFAAWDVVLACVSGPALLPDGFYSHDNLIDGISGQY